MKNVVMLHKGKDGNIYCKEITKKGIEYVETFEGEDPDYWDEGGTILLEELEEILDKEI
jgi:hypothetical protein